MPTKKEDEAYRRGYIKGLQDMAAHQVMMQGLMHPADLPEHGPYRSGIPESNWPSILDEAERKSGRRPVKRKLSKWQKFVKANSKKKKFIYQSGAKKGKLNLKKMGVEYRRKNK